MDKDQDINLNNISDKSNLIHFIGIGGIGMSALAQILHSRGYFIQGSDLKETYTTEKLKKIGIKVLIGHHKNNILEANLIIKSTAIKDENIEIFEALERGIRILTRDQLLSQIMKPFYNIAITGTHGKTTTTGLIGSLSINNNMDPIVLNGGFINQYGTNAICGKGKILVAEADESDGTFIKIPIDIGVITNIDVDHLDYFKTIENMHSEYKLYIKNISDRGCAILCMDHPVLRKIFSEMDQEKIITYNIKEEFESDIKAIDIKNLQSGSTFNVKLSKRIVQKFGLNFSFIENIYLNLYGLHNVQNSLAAIAVSLKLNIHMDTLKKTLSNFEGIKRRLTLVGEVNNILIYDDYAHLPQEIEATLQASKSIAESRRGNLIAIMQPHKFTRLQYFMDEFSLCFRDANSIIISEVYSADESPIPEINSKILCNKIKMNFCDLNSKSEKFIKFLSNWEELPSVIKEISKPNDVVVFLGGGDITDYAKKLPNQIEKIL